MYRISAPAGNGIIPSNIAADSTCIKAVVLSAFLPLRQILTGVRIGAQNFCIFFITKMLHYMLLFFIAALPIVILPRTQSGVQGVSPSLINCKLKLFKV